MSLVEVVCDVSSIIVVFGPAPNLEVCGQHFGMGGPMQMHLFTACHIAILYHPLEIVELGVTWKTSGGKALVLLRTLKARRLG